MNQETKNRLDLLLHLADRATGRFNQRMSVEWRVCISLWTALGAAAYALGTNKVRLQPAAQLTITCGLFVVLAVFICWLCWLKKTQDRDQKTAYFWENLVEVPVGKRPDRLVPKKHEGGEGPTANFITDAPHIIQLLTTVVFLLILGGTIWKDCISEKPKEVDEQKSNAAMYCFFQNRMRRPIGRGSGSGPVGLVQQLSCGELR